MYREAIKGLLEVLEQLVGMHFLCAPTAVHQFNLSTFVFSPLLACNPANMMMMSLCGSSYKLHSPYAGHGNHGAHGHQGAQEAGH
jgi:hypothetical protein